MYVGQYNRVHALDAATGRLIWEHFRQPPSVGWQRGIGIYGDMVYMIAQDSALVALDRRTGNPNWEARPSQPGKRFQGPMPFAAKGLIIVSGSGQGGGFIEAFDALTGKPRWRWNTIPGPGEPGHETWMGDSWRNGGGPVWVSRQLRSAAQSRSTGARGNRVPISSATTAKATTSTPTASWRSTSTPGR